MNNGSNPQIPPRHRGGRRPSNLAGDCLHAQATAPTPSRAMMDDYLHGALPTPRTMSRPPGRARQAHRPQPLNLAPDGLGPHERVTVADILLPTGGWAGYPGALISSDWEQGAVMAVLAEATGHPIHTFAPDPARWILTPRGRFPYRRALAFWVGLRGMTSSPVLLLLPILEAEVAGHLRMSLALGRPFVEAYFGDDWPPLNCVQPQAGGGDSTFPGTVWEDAPAGSFSVANSPMGMANVPMAAPGFPPSVSFPTTNFPMSVSMAHTPTVAHQFLGNERLNSWLSDMYPPQQEE